MFILISGEVPNLSYSFDDLSVDENSEEDPVFNDISSLLKHKIANYGKGYLDNVLDFKMSAENRLRHLRLKTENTLKRQLKSLKNMFDFSQYYSNE